MTGLLDEAIDRRAFVRRFFAMGAGVAVGGSLIRQIELIVAPARWGGVITYHNTVVTSAMWDALLNEHYVKTHLIEAVSNASPFLLAMRRRPS